MTRFGMITLIGNIFITPGSSFKPLLATSPHPLASTLEVTTILTSITGN